MKEASNALPGMPGGLMDEPPPPPAGERLYPDISGYTHIPERFWGRWLAAVVICVLIAALANAFAHGQIAWRYVATFFTARSILSGLVNTIAMSIAAMALAVMLGIIAAVMRVSRNPVVQGAAMGYAWLFRGTPVILQLLLWFNLALVFPVLGVPGLWHMRTVEVITPMLASLLGLGLNEGAYTSEIIRAGMLSVDIGQIEAAKSIGMGHTKMLRRIVFPQAMRVIIPPLGNSFIGMIKLTSLASVIQFSEILHNAQNIYYANSRVIELLIVVGIWYLILVSILTPLQMLLERKYSKGIGRLHR